MSQGTISGVSPSHQSPPMGDRPDRASAQKVVNEARQADLVQLSSEGRRRLEELINSETVAEAYLNYLTDPSREVEASGKDQEPGEEEAKKRFSTSLKDLSFDIGWLLDALEIGPEEAAKVTSVISSRSAAHYAQSRPPVPEVILRAELDKAGVAVFVQGLSFTTGRDGIEDVRLERISVIRMNPTLSNQLADPDFPRVVVVGGSEDDKRGDTAASVAAFNDNLSARLAATPPAQLHGMLMVRDVTAAQTEARRLRVDALNPI